MSDNGEEDEDVPVVELGDGDAVDGAPVARVASRLFFPIERSEVVRREGETTVRTPDGPRAVADVLDESDEVYFETSHDLVATVRSVVGSGPVPTAGGGSASSAAEEGPDGEADAADATDDGATDAVEGDDDTDEDADEEGGFEFDDG